MSGFFYIPESVIQELDAATAQADTLKVLAEKLKAECKKLEQMQRSLYE